MSNQKTHQGFNKSKNRILDKAVPLIKNSPSTIKENKASIIVTITWLTIAEISGNSIIKLIGLVLRLVLYPFELILFETEFRDTDIPEVFILLTPLVVLVTLGFLIIIATED